MTPQKQESAADALSESSPVVGESATVANELGRAAVIAAMAFLTLVDLFATQAILPSLASHYGTTPAQTGLAVNATTLGMAIASLCIALFAATHRSARRRHRQSLRARRPDRTARLRA